MCHAILEERNEKKKQVILTFLAGLHHWYIPERQKQKQQQLASDWLWQVMGATLARTMAAVIGKNTVCQWGRNGGGDALNVVWKSWSKMTGRENWLTKGERGMLWLRATEGVGFGAVFVGGKGALEWFKRVKHSEWSVLYSWKCYKFKGINISSRLDTIFWSFFF